MNSGTGTIGAVSRGHGRLKAGLVLEAIATQRGSALCGRAALGTLLPMLECMFRQPCATLLLASQRHQQQQRSNGATPNATFLSGMTAQEEAALAAARAEEESEAVDTLQLCLGVLLAVFDPETEAAAREFSADQQQLSPPPGVLQMTHHHQILASTFTPA